MVMERPKEKHFLPHNKSSPAKFWQWQIREFFRPMWRRGIIYLFLVIFLANVDIGTSGANAIVGIVITLAILATEFYYWAIYKMD